MNPSSPGTGEHELRTNPHWRRAVWALRFGFVVLATGLLALALSIRWLLAVAAILWILAAAVTLTEVFRARGEHSEPRPGFWPMRWALLHDTVRRRRAD